MMSQNLPKLCQTMILSLSSPASLKVEFACRRHLWMIPLDWKVGLRLTHWAPHTQSEVDHKQPGCCRPTWSPTASHLVLRAHSVLSYLLRE